MELLFLISLLIIAFLYASVGHGGASGYLAMMIIFGVSSLTMRSSVLLMNILVSSIAFINFYKAGYFRWNLLWPFVVTSIPFSFIGSIIRVRSEIFQVLLLFCLIIGIFRLIYTSNTDYIIRSVKIIPSFIIGSIIGFISGIVGIGGGILLSPILIILRWGNTKEIASVSALFIIINSVVGLLGTLYNKQLFLNINLIYNLIFVLIGAFTGSYIGCYYWKSRMLKYILALVLCIACFKLLIF